MFEYDQQVVDELLRSNDEFMHLYGKHWSLDQKLKKAMEPAERADEQTLAKLKKEKLHIKDRLAMLISQRRNLQ